MQNNTVMPIFLARTVEFVRIEQVSALDKFYYMWFPIEVDKGYKVVGTSHMSDVDVIPTYW
jgi:hypothetical protein